MAVTINGINTTVFRLEMPQIGNWRIVASAVEDVSEGAKVKVDVAGIALNGTVRRGGTHANRTRLEIMGGNGGLDDVIRARSYVQGMPGSATVRTILTDIMRDAGETASSTIASSVLSTELVRWVRRQTTAGQAISQLAQALSLTWRVLADGAVWIGVDAYEDVTKDANITFIDRDRAAKAAHLAAADPLRLLPGKAVRLDGEAFRIGRLQITEGGSSLRCTLREAR